LIRIITNLFPKVHNPQYGIFIKEQADAISTFESIDIVVLKSKFPALTQNWKIYADEPFINPHESLSVSTCSIFDFPKNVFIKFTLKKINKSLLKMTWTDVSLVHIHYLYPGVLVTPFLISKKIPFILHVHGSDWGQFRARKKLDNLIENALTHSKKIVFSGQENFLEAQKEYGNKCMYMPNGVNFKEIDENPTTDFYEKPTAICIANVTAVKGLHRLKYISNLKTNSSWNIHVYGKIVDKSIKKDIEKSFLSSNHSIQFFDAQPKHVVLAAMSKSHVFLHTSEKESFGLAVTEALYIGLPVAGTETGILTSIESHKGLLKTDFCNDLNMIDFLNKHEKFTRYQLNSQSVESYNMENYVTNLLNVYSEFEKNLR
jgi:hypothetical protein